MSDNRQKSGNTKIRTQILPTINKEKITVDSYLEYKFDTKTNSESKLHRIDTPHQNYEENGRIMEKKDSVNPTLILPHIKNDLPQESTMYKEVKKNEEISKTSAIEVSTKCSNNIEYKENIKKEETIVSSIGRVITEESKEVYSHSSFYDPKGEDNKCNIS